MNEINTPLAARQPTFLARPTPWTGSCLDTTGKLAVLANSSITDGVVSVEPLSTTTSSHSNFERIRAKCAKHLVSPRARFFVPMTTDNIIVLIRYNFGKGVSRCQASERIRKSQASFTAKFRSISFDHLSDWIH